MAGRIKSGEGTLIGNAGEYYVVAELLKRGVIAALAPRNDPAFDIIATKGSRTVRIRVKTKSAEYEPGPRRCAARAPRKRPLLPKRHANDARSAENLLARAEPAEPIQS